LPPAQDANGDGQDGRTDSHPSLQLELPGLLVAAFLERLARLLELALLCFQLPAAGRAGRCRRVLIPARLVQEVLREGRTVAIMAEDDLRIAIAQPDVGDGVEQVGALLVDRAQCVCGLFGETAVTLEAQAWNGMQLRLQRAQTFEQQGALESQPRISIGVRLRAVDPAGDTQRQPGKLRCGAGAAMTETHRGQQLQFAEQAVTRRHLIRRAERDHCVPRCAARALQVDPPGHLVGRQLRGKAAETDPGRGRILDDEFIADDFEHAFARIRRLVYLQDATAAHLDATDVDADELHREIDGCADPVYVGMDLEGVDGVVAATQRRYDVGQVDEQVSHLRRMAAQKLLIDRPGRSRLRCRERAGGRINLGPARKGAHQPQRRESQW